MANWDGGYDVRTNKIGNTPASAGGNGHYVYWLGQDGNLWVNQNGNTFSIGSPANNNWQNGRADGMNFSMGGSGTLIDDPNPGNRGGGDSVSLNDLSDYNSTGSYYSASDAEALRKQKEAEEKAEKQRLNIIAGYNKKIDNTNNSIDSLAGALQNKLDSINGEYNTYKNEQESAYNQQKNSYDTSSRQNMNDLVDNRNKIMDRASMGLQGLLAVLGAHGAGGSSAALYDVPNMVKRQADYENNGVGSTYRSNQSQLDTNWGNYLIGHENDKKKLEDWRTGQEKSAKQEIEQKRIDLLNQLSDFYAERAKYDYADPSSLLDNVNGRIKTANQAIQDLGKYTAPKYNGITAVYDSPELSSYDTGKFNISTETTPAKTSDSQSLLTTLQDLRDRKKQDNGLEA